MKASRSYVRRISDSVEWGPHHDFELYSCGTLVMGDGTVLEPGDWEQVQLAVPIKPVNYVSWKEIEVERTAQRKREKAYYDLYDQWFSGVQDSIRQTIREKVKEGKRTAKELYEELKWPDEVVARKWQGYLTTILGSNSALRAELQRKYPDCVKTQDMYYIEARYKQT
jgi:hypothetical protein